MVGVIREADLTAIHNHQQQIRVGALGGLTPMSSGCSFFSNRACGTVLWDDNDIIESKTVLWTYRCCVFIHVTAVLESRRDCQSKRVCDVAQI